MNDSVIPHEATKSPTAEAASSVEAVDAESVAPAERETSQRTVPRRPVPRVRAGDILLVRNGEEMAAFRLSPGDS